MVIEVLTPCVQNGRYSDVGTEVLTIGGNGSEGLGRSLKQQAIHLGLVLVGNRTDRGRKLEHRVKIRHRQKLGCARRKPCRRSRPLAFSAVPIAAAIIGDACVRTVLAAVDMTAERGSATNLDCRHDAPLGKVYVAGIGCAPRLTMAAEDIPYLQLRSEHVRVTQLVTSRVTLPRRGDPRPAPSAGPAGAELRGRRQPPGRRKKSCSDFRLTILILCPVMAVYAMAYLREVVKFMFVDTSDVDDRRFVKIRMAVLSTLFSLVFSVGIIYSIYDFSTGANMKPDDLKEQLALIETALGGFLGLIVETIFGKLPPKAGGASG